MQGQKSIPADGDEPYSRVDLSVGFDSPVAPVRIFSPGLFIGLPGNLSCLPVARFPLPSSAFANR